MSENDSTSRRTVLKFGALASVGAITGGAGLTTAQSEENSPIGINVYPEEEYVALRNTGEESIDLTGYSLNFDAEGGNDQIRQLADGAVLPNVYGDDGHPYRNVPTGAREVDLPLIVELQDPDNSEVLADDGSDVVALLDPDGNVVATSENDNDTKTGIVRVVDQNGDPVEGEPVRFVNLIHDGVVEELTTDENGYAILILGSSDPSDVIDYDVEVRDQTKSLPLESDAELGVSEVSFEVDTSDDDETHTATVVVTDIDGVRLEGFDVDVNTYEAGEDVAEGTTDDCGEVQFEVEDGGYEVRAYTNELAQSSANMGLSVREDTTYVINLYDTDEYDGEAPEDGRNITEPEPCEGAEVNPGDGDNTGDGDDTDDETDDSTGDDTDEGETDDDPSPNTDRTDDPEDVDEDEDIPSSEELADRTSESYESESDSGSGSGSDSDDCPTN